MVPCSACEMIRLVFFLVASYAALAVEPKLPDLGPFVRTMLPAGADRGKTVAVEFRGQRLAGASAIEFDRPDLSAEIRSSSFYEVRAQIMVGKEVPPGFHAYRLTTPRGSYSGRIHVSSLPPVKEVEPNNEYSKAQKITLPAVIDGVIDNGDYDNYRLHLEAGQTIVLDVVGNRGSSFLNAKLAVLDERGEEVAFNDGWHLGGDPHLTFTAPKAGDYVAQVGPAFEFGNRDFSYRLLAGIFPFAIRVLPAGLQAGKTAEVELAGVNLDRVTGVLLGDAMTRGEIVNREPGRLTARIPVPERLRGKQHLYLESKEGLAPAPSEVLVSDLPEGTLRSPAPRVNPHAIAIPSAVSGVLEKDQDRHYYAFTAGTGQRLSFEIQSMQLGYPLDTTISVFDQDGKLIVSQDEPARPGPRQIAQMDPRLVHTFPKGGRYLLQVRESGRLTSPDFVYRLSIQAAEPDFQLEAYLPALTLYRGRENKLEVRVKRLGGWDTPVDVWVDELPPGIESARATAEPKNSAYNDANAKLREVDGTDVELILKVAPGVRGGSFPLKIRGRGVRDGKVVEHSQVLVYPASFFAQLSGPIPGAEVVASVTDLPPVVMNVPQAFGVTAGKNDKLKVPILRFDGEKAPLPVRVLSLPKGVTVEEIALAPGFSQVELRFQTEKQVQAGKHVITVKAGDIESQPIDLNVAAAPAEEKK